jgi:4-oxalocrotonate tautomerase
MPIVEITLIEGRDDEAKTRLCAKVTDAVIEAVGAPRESVRVILREIPPTHFAVGGVTRAAAKAAAPAKAG